jgi:hypothetical protein
MASTDCGLGGGVLPNRLTKLRALCNGRRSRTRSCGLEFSKVPAPDERNNKQENLEVRVDP